MNELASLGPFLVPLGAFAVAIAALWSGAWRSAQVRRINAEQRLAMLNRGMSIAEIEQVLGSHRADGDRLPHDPVRQLGKARRAGIVLISSGVGVIAFGAVLAVITDREKLVVAALGLVPLAIGIGFLIDYRMQGRELERFGSEVGVELSES